MLDIFRTRKFVILDNQHVVATFNRHAHRANALALLIASDPQIHLGRLPLRNASAGVSLAASSSVKSGAGGSPVLKVEDIQLTPALMAITESFSPSAAVSSLFSLLDLEFVMSANLGKEKITGVLSSGMTLLGAHFHNFIHLESASLIPIPFNRALNDRASPISLLRPYLSKYVKTGKVRVATEPAEEQIDAVSVILDSAAPINVFESLTSLQSCLTLSAGTKRSASPNVLKMESDKLALTKVPLGMTEAAWLEGYMAFILSLNDMAAFKSAFETVKSHANVEHLKTFLVDAQLEIHKVNFAAAGLITYYCISPMIRDLKYFFKIFEHPHLIKLIDTAYVDVLGNPKFVAFRDFVMSFELPPFMATEFEQSVCDKVDVGGTIMPTFAIESSIYKEFANDRGKFMSLFSPTGLLMQMVELQLVLENSYIKTSLLLDISRSLGRSIQPSSSPMNLVPFDKSNISVGDGFRSTRPFSSIIDWTRTHYMHISDANRMNLTLKRRVYNPDSIQKLSLRLDGAAPTEIQFLQSDLFEVLNDKGFVDQPSSFFFMKKSNLNESVILALRSSRAANMIPFPFTASMSSEDTFVRVENVDALINRLGYFGESSDILTQIPYARRLITINGDGSNVVASMILVGPTALKLITHTLVQTVSAFNHWEFTLLDLRFGSVDSMSIVPSFAYVSLPTDEKEIFSLSSSYEMDPTTDVLSRLGIRIYGSDSSGS